jgi:hypothetical protein
MVEQLPSFSPLQLELPIWEGKKLASEDIDGIKEND